MNIQHAFKNRSWTDATLRLANNNERRKGHHQLISTQCFLTLTDQSPWIPMKTSANPQEEKESIGPLP